MLSDSLQQIHRARSSTAQIHQRRRRGDGIHVRVLASSPSPSEEGYPWMSRRLQVNAPQPALPRSTFNTWWPTVYLVAAGSAALIHFRRSKLDDCGQFLGSASGTQLERRLIAAHSQRYQDCSGVRVYYTQSAVPKRTTGPAGQLIPEKSQTCSDDDTRFQDGRSRLK